MQRVGRVRKISRKVVVLVLSLVDVILEMLHDSVTAGHIGVWRMLACV